MRVSYEPDGGFLSPGERGSLLAELRRRIAGIRTEPTPVEVRPSWPVAPRRAWGAPRRGTDLPARARRLLLEDLPGATLEDGIVVVSTRYDASHVVGTVAPADALVAPPGVLAALAGLGGADPEVMRGVRLLDCETTGLAGGAGTLAFLIGVARFEDDGALIVDQLLMPSPADEPELLDRLAARLAGGTLLVTFNGRSFDGPLLRTRHVMARRPPGALASLPHLDLLPLARRLWRGRGENCRQLTLERTVLGVHREDDVPGAMAPAAYAALLQTGDATAVEGIVRHNRDDVVGMTALLAAALRVLEAPDAWAEDAGELVAVGEEWLRRGQPGRAAPILSRGHDLARHPELQQRALRQLARAFRQAGDLDGARRTWQRVRETFPRVAR